MKLRKNEALMSNDARIAVLETTILNINTTLQDIKGDLKNLDRKIDTKFDILDKKIDTKFDILDKKIDTKFDTLDKKIDGKFDFLQSRLWSNHFWLMGMIIGLAGLIAHTQHWI